MRVVFDSNIFISALMFPGGRADAAVERILDGRDELIISRDLIREVVSVMASKVSRDKEELSRVAALLADLGRLLEPARRLRVLADDPDNRVLECALAGTADAIVTGDKAMLAIQEFEGIRIQSLSAYLAVK